MRLPNSAAPLLVNGLAAFSLLYQKTPTNRNPLPNEQPSSRLVKREPDPLNILAVSASEIDLSKLDVKTLVTKMTPPRTTPAQWRVVWTGDASREATISWTTAEPGKKHVVYYGPGPAERTVNSHGVRNVNLMAFTPSSNLSRGENRTGVLYTPDQNLKPNTRYYFVMESDGERSENSTSEQLLLAGLTLP